MADLIALLVLGIAAAIGWRRGTLLMALSVAGIVAGYVAAVILFRPAGSLLARVVSVPPILAMPLAGMLVMFVVSAAIKFASKRAARERSFKIQNGWEPPRADQAGGAALGSAWAALIVLVVAWAVMSLRSIAHVGPDIERSMTGRAATAALGKAFYAVAKRATGDPLIARLSSLLASRPTDGARTLQALVGNQHVHSLLTDPALLGALARGDASALAASSQVQGLAADAGFMDAARQLGLSAGQGGAQSLAAGLVEGAGPLARSVESLREDPAVRDLLNDPGLRQRFEQGDVQGLLTDARFNQLAGRILQSLRGSTSP